LSKLRVTCALAKPSPVCLQRSPVSELFGQYFDDLPLKDSLRRSGRLPRHHAMIAFNVSATGGRARWWSPHDLFKLLR
jgi:hypothetical protein